MTKATGIDIGRSCIHLVELDGSARKYRVANCVTLPRSAIAPVEDEEVGADEAQRLLVDDLKAAFHEGVSRDRALVSVQGAHCILRNITLPFRGRDEIRKVLKFEAEGYIHSHSIDDVVVDAVVVDERADGTEMFMAACPKPPLDAQLKALHKAGCDPERADLDASLLVEAGVTLGVFKPATEAAEADEESEESAAPAQQDIDLVLGIGASSIQMILVRDAQLWTVRVLRWGLDRLERSLADRLSVTPDEASAALMDWFGGAEAIEEEGDEAVFAGGPPVKLQTDDLRRASSELANRIVKEITRFQSGFDLEHRPRRIFLTGGGSRIPGLLEALAAATELPTEPLDLIGRSGANGADHRPELDGAFSAALAALGSTRSVMNFRQEELAFRPKFDRLKFPLAVCAMLLALFTFVKWVKLRQKIQANERNIGLVDEKRSKKGQGRSQRLPVYHGLLRFIAHPQEKSSYLLARLDDRAEAMKILKGLPNKSVYQRSGYIVRELNKLKRRLETETGYFRELKLESGLSVLQGFAAAIDKAAKDPAVGRFAIPSIDLTVGTSPRQTGSLKFTISFNGDVDTLRVRNSKFKEHMNAACGPNGPFKSFERIGKETLHKGGFENALQLDYFFELHDQIPMFQPRGVKQ